MSVFAINQCTVEIVDASIVALDVEAIVNAANPTLAGGGGVDRAIHAAAGPQLKLACLQFPELRPAVRCEVGEVKVTPGFQLRAKYVLHTVGPNWVDGSRGEPELLARCYQRVFVEVTQLKLASVGVPAISTGAYGYPDDKAAKIVAHETTAFARSSGAAIRVVFACVEAATAKQLRRAFTRSESTQSG